jgi:hypothetical protein
MCSVTHPKDVARPDLMPLPPGYDPFAFMMKAPALATDLPLPKEPSKTDGPPPSSTVWKVAVQCSDYNVATTAHDFVQNHALLLAQHAAMDTNNRPSVEQANKTSTYGTDASMLARHTHHQHISTFRTKGRKETGHVHFRNA